MNTRKGTDLFLSLIDYHGLGKDGGTLINKINSISSVKNPTKYEQGLIRGAELLKKAGYEGFKMAKKVKLGDILQVLTPQGVAYAQVTHKHPEFGFLIRVFPGIHNEQPKDFSEVVQGEPQFSAFFVVQSAVNQGLLSVVANVPVPERLQVFPTFRSRNGGPGGSIWLWNGSEALRLEREISSEELKHSIRGIISAPLLVERIEKNYRAETHEVW